MSECDFPIGGTVDPTPDKVEADVSDTRSADVSGTETKREMYLRQSKRAAAEVATWPEWMQRNLEPPTETVHEETLDSAWANVEASMPEGWEFLGLRTWGHGWEATAAGPMTTALVPCVTCGQLPKDPPKREFAFGKGTTKEYALRDVLVQLKKKVGNG